LANALLPQGGFVALTCPLTAETEKLIDAHALGRVKPSAYLVNAARGRVVDEAALVVLLMVGLVILLLIFYLPIILMPPSSTLLP
jgi:D-2-hydroxyacid dehydrogenase (NADP+)